MQLTTALATAAMASTALANIQVNYYSDGGCYDYLGQVDVTWAGSVYGKKSNCYKYHYGTSANIASASGNAECTFFADEKCSRGALRTDFSNGWSKCLGDMSAYRSFACYYT